MDQNPEEMKIETQQLNVAKEQLKIADLSLKSSIKIEGALDALKTSMIGYSDRIQAMLAIQTDALNDKARSTKYENVKGSTDNAPRKSGAADTINAISQASPIMGGAGIGLASLGVGIGGFFLGLAGAEAIMENFGGGENLKKLITNLGDALESLDTRSMAALGALVAGSALFAANTKLGTQFKVATGMTLLGAGIGGFFAGLSAGDAAMSWMDVDGSKLKAMLQNLGDGLAAFSGRDLSALGALLTGSALFAANTSLGGQFKVATGMTAIGAGIGGFFAGLTGVTDMAAFLGADGEGIKKMMTNVAEGLAAFSGRDLSALGAMLAVGGLFGAVPGGLVLAGGAALGMTAIGAGIGGFFTGISAVGDAAAYFGVDGSGVKTMMVNLGEGLTAFSTVDSGKVIGATSAMFALAPALVAFFGAQGLSSILDSVTRFVTWATGGDDPITTVVTQIRKFEAIDTAKLENAKGVGLGSIMSDLATGLSAFSSANFDAAVLGVLTDVANWFSGGDTPFDAIAKIGEKSDLLDSAATSMERLSEALKKFAEVPAGMEFDFSKLAEQLAAAVPLFDALLHGGEIDDWGFNTVIEKGLLDPEFNLDAGIDAINKVKAALTEVYSMSTTPGVNISPSATVGAGGMSASTQAAEVVSEKAAATINNFNAPTVNNNGGNTTNNTTSTTTIIQTNPHTSVSAYMPQ